MIAGSFPKIYLAGLGWVAPGLMLASALGASGGQAFRLGWLAGFANWLAAAYWLLLIPVPIAPIVGWLLLGAFLGLYSGAWVWLAWKVFPKRIEPAASWMERMDSFLSVSWHQRMLWCLGCAALWVTWEMAQARILSGFPWNPLGASQYQMVPLIQIASVTAVYGVSFLMVWFSAALACGVAMTLRRPHQRWAGLREVFAPLLAVVTVVSLGVSKVSQPTAPSERLRVALIQPSIPQTQIWDPEADLPRFRQLLSLSEAALTEKPQLLVWPEAAVPSYFRWNTNQIGGRTVQQAITDLARRHKVWIITGADDLEPSSTSPQEINYFNSSFVITPGGEIGANYRKRRLVMFGEYVPLARWLPFLKDFTGVHGAFTPGTKPVAFRLGGVTTSVLICFEDVFAHLAREYVQGDTDFLLNLTNNGWFGESAAQWQHAVAAIFRAVENRTPLVRCANNGLSCWVDSNGRMHDVYFPDSNNIYKAGYKISEVPLLGEANREFTFYTRHGDVFGWACVAVSVLLLLLSLYKARARSMPLAERN